MLVNELCSNSLRVVAEKGGSSRMVDEMEEKTIEVIWSVEQLKAKARDMAAKRDSLGAKFERLGLGAQCMRGMDKEEKHLRACVAVMEKASKTKTSRVGTKRRIADIDVVTEDARAERTEHTVWIGQLKGYLHELEGKSNVLKGRNNVNDS